MSPLSGLGTGHDFGIHHGGSGKAVREDSTCKSHTESAADSSKLDSSANGYMKQRIEYQYHARLQAPECQCQPEARNCCTHRACWHFGEKGFEICIFNGRDMASG